MQQSDSQCSSVRRLLTYIMKIFAETRSLPQFRNSAESGRTIYLSISLLTTSGLARLARIWAVAGEDARCSSADASAVLHGWLPCLCNSQPIRRDVRYTVKNIRISTDILWNVGARVSLFRRFADTNVYGTSRVKIRKTRHEISVDIRFILQCSLYCRLY